jgi:hypothetical protein
MRRPETSPNPLIFLCFFRVSIAPILTDLFFSFLNRPPHPSASPIPVRHPHFSSRPVSITFSVPPFPPHLSDIASITFPTWLSSQPGSRILLFNDSNFPDLFARLPANLSSHILHGPPLDADEVGLPYADDFLQKSVDLTTTDFLCVIMVDTILPQNFGNSATALFKFYSVQGKQFAALGRRCQIPRPDITTAEEYRTAPSLISCSLIDNADYSNDFILISMNTQELDFAEVPPFHLGMQHWDVWIGGWLRSRVPTVAIGGRCGSFHIKHEIVWNMLSKMRDNVQLSYRRGSEVASAVGLSLVLKDGKLIDGDKVIAVLSE